MNYSEALLNPAKAVMKKGTNETVSAHRPTLFIFFINSEPAADLKLVEFWMKPDKHQ